MLHKRRHATVDGLLARTLMHYTDDNLSRAASALMVLARQLDKRDEVEEELPTVDTRIGDYHAATQVAYKFGFANIEHLLNHIAKRTSVKWLYRSRFNTMCDDGRDW